MLGGALPKANRPGSVAFAARLDPVEVSTAEKAGLASQEDLGRLSGSIVFGAPAEELEVREIARMKRSDEVVGVLGAHSSVHQAIGERKNACCKPMSAEVTRLPEVSDTRLERAVHRASVLRATAIATTVHADEHRWIDGLLGNGVEIELGEILEAVELDMLCETVRRNDHEEWATPGTAGASDELKARPRSFEPRLETYACR